jgi:hypothetical protein
MRPAQHPLAADVAVWHVMLATAEYGAQQQPRRQQLGDKAFVASFKRL